MSQISRTSSIKLPCIYCDIHDKVPVEAEQLSLLNDKDVRYPDLMKVIDMMNRRDSQNTVCRSI